jgi:hypothetical protein
MKNCETNIYDLTEVYSSTIREEKSRSINLDVVLVRRSKSPIDEVKK